MAETVTDTEKGVKVPKENGGALILLTGGAGCMGQALVRELRRWRSDGRIDCRLRVYDRVNRNYEDDWVENIVADVRDYDSLKEAMKGCLLVINAAAQIDWGNTPEEEVRSVNITGTENVIRACRETGVNLLLHTSTLDVMYESKPMINVDEEDPYPEGSGGLYPDTKRDGERLVMAANGSDLMTVVLRPGGMWGEADPYHITELYKIAASKAMPFRIGSGSAVFQYLYVGNAAHAHLIVMEKMLQGNRNMAGKAYHITDFPAENFFDLPNRILEPLGIPLPPKGKWVPCPLMYAVGAMAEGLAWLLRPVVKLQPAITRSSVRFVCVTMTTRGERLKNDAGYEPVYSLEEAVERTVEWFRLHGPVEE